jgi:hypothetical protein
LKAYTSDDSLICFTQSQAAQIYEDLQVRRDSIDFLIENCKLKDYLFYRRQYRVVKDSVITMEAAYRKDILYCESENKKVRGQRNVLIGVVLLATLERTLSLVYLR